MIRIGKIVATHGLQGGLVFTHVLNDANWLKVKHVLMVEMHKGSFIPYFISNLKANNKSEYIISLEDLATVEQAKKLVTKQVYVDEEIIKSFAQKSPLLWIGFNVIDSTKGDLGKIEDVLQTGSQWIAKITIDNKEVLLPIIEQTVKKLDINNRKIYMELPEGLLEIYL